MINTKTVIAKLRQIQIKEKNDILSSDADSPFFFIYPVRKNTPYIELLILLLSDFPHTIDYFSRLLIQRNWGSLEIESTLTLINKRISSVASLQAASLDIAYCALLINKISEVFFFDYAIFVTLQKSFPLASKHAVTDTPLTAKNICCDNLLKHSSNDPYIKSIIEKNNKNFIPLNEKQFLNTLKKLSPIYYFTITLDLTFDEFLCRIKNTSHNGWFQLFFREKYSLLDFKINSDNKLQIHIPSRQLLQAFLIAISPKEKNIIKPVLSYGIISMSTSHNLHQQGLHIISIQDARFKSVSFLHGEKSNGFEVFMHDFVFHTITLSATTLPVRRLFLNSIFPLLKQFLDAYTRRDSNTNEHSLNTRIKHFFYMHLVGTTLDVSMWVPREKTHTVTSAALYISLYILLGSIKQTHYYFFHDASAEDLTATLTEAIQALFLYLKIDCDHKKLISILEKHLLAILFKIDDSVESSRLLTIYKNIFNNI